MNTFKLTDKSTGNTYNISAENEADAARIFKANRDYFKSLSDNNQQNNIQNNFDNILSRYNERLDINQPYIDKLGDYINNYDKLQSNAYEFNRFNTALAGLSGNQGYKNLKYNPAEIEATRLDLLNKMLQAKAGRISAEDDLLGKMAWARDYGMSPEIALLDKDTFKAMSPIISSYNALKGRTYATDINSQTKLQIAKMKLEGDLRRAQMSGNVRLQVATKIALANVNRALINSMGFGGANAGDIANVYNQMGYGNIDTSNLSGQDLNEYINRI